MICKEKNGKKYISNKKDHFAMQNGLFFRKPPDLFV